MRTTRLKKFRKSRYRKIKRFILFTIIIPSTSILLGYILTTAVILPMIYQ